MKKLKLNRLSDQNLAEKQMNTLTGGEASQCPAGCCCACRYANQGGSSSSDNGKANTAGGLHSTGCYIIVAQE